VKKFVLGLQHLLAAFGATILVPLLVGIDPKLALFSAGVGTLIFHICTKMKVPVFLGSSFAFVAPLITVFTQTGDYAYAAGGSVVAGALYLVFAMIVKIVGGRKNFEIISTTYCRNNDNNYWHDTSSNCSKYGL